MDLVTPQWFATVTLGTQTTEWNQVSLRTALAEFARLLSQSDGRFAGRHSKTITLHLSTSPPLEQAQTQGLIQDAMRPDVGEAVESFLGRCEDSGMDSRTAHYLCREWYPHLQDIDSDHDWAQWTAWLNDSNAQRFRTLNTNSAAYESSTAGEYGTLLDDMRARFPEFLAHMTLRIAI